jgi:hypothetical protein
VIRRSLLFALCILEMGCTTRYAKIRLLSQPDLADVRVVENGEYLGTTPNMVVVRGSFSVLPPFRLRYTFRFEKAGHCDEDQRVKIDGIWRATRQQAENGAEFFTVGGVLNHPPCATARRP